jgi:hypothetical protein
VLDPDRFDKLAAIKAKATERAITEKSVARTRLWRKRTKSLDGTRTAAGPPARLDTRSSLDAESHPVLRQPEIRNRPPEPRV